MTWMNTTTKPDIGNSHPKRILMPQSVNDSPTTENNLPEEDLLDRVQEKYARIKGLSLISDIQLTRRSARRLDAQSRAVRKQQGLEMEDPPDNEEIVLGDKTIYYGNLPWSKPPPSKPDPPAPRPPDPEPDPPAPRPDPPTPQQPRSKLLPYALALLLGLGGLAIGVGVTAFLMSLFLGSPQESQVLDYDTGFGVPEDVTP